MNITNYTTEWIMLLTLFAITAIGFIGNKISHKMRNNKRIELEKKCTTCNKKLEPFEYLDKECHRCKYVY